MNTTPLYRFVKASEHPQIEQSYSCRLAGTEEPFIAIYKNKHWQTPAEVPIKFEWDFEYLSELPTPSTDADLQKELTELAEQIHPYVCPKNKDGDDIMTKPGQGAPNSTKYAKKIRQLVSFAILAIQTERQRRGTQEGGILKTDEPAFYEIIKNKIAAAADASPFVQNETEQESFSWGAAAVMKNPGEFGLMFKKNVDYLFKSIKNTYMKRIPTATENPKGLHQRYRIQKLIGGEPKPVDNNAEYFVLRLDQFGSDPKHIEACRIGVNAYAEAIKDHLPELAKDLKERYPLTSEQDEKIKALIMTMIDNPGISYTDAVRKTDFDTVFKDVNDFPYPSDTERFWDWYCRGVGEGDPEENEWVIGKDVMLKEDFEKAMQHLLQRQMLGLPQPTEVTTETAETILNEEVLFKDGAGGQYRISALVAMERYASSRSLKDGAIGDAFEAGQEYGESLSFHRRERQGEPWPNLPPNKETYLNSLNK